MQNYLLDKKGEDEYITSVVEEDNKTLTITFADGRVFRNIKASEENIAKIIEAQENQAIIGLNNYETFAKRKKYKESFMLATFSVTGCVAVAATYIPSVASFLDQNPGIYIAGFGVISVLGMIPSGIKLCQENRKLKELDLIRYIDEYKETLEKYRDYPNALAGLKPEIAEWFIKEDDPFSILNLDLLSLDDLRMIMKNIKVEQDFEFTYKKTKKTNS